MRRRDFIKVIAGSATAWPLGAHAQQPLVGYLFSGAAASAFGAAEFKAFKKGLAQTGYVEGQNVAIEYRSAEGQYDRLPALAARSGWPQGFRPRRGRRHPSRARGQSGDHDYSDRLRHGL